MTEQQIDLERLRAVAHHAEQANSAVYLAPRSLLDLLDQLEQAEADRDRLLRSSRLAKEGGPQTAEDNAHRDADRKHAAHVADMLARAARRDEEKR